MKLTQYLDGLRAARSPEELDAAVRAPFTHSFRGPTWTRICRVRIEAAHAIIDAHPHGRFVPRIATRRRLTVCGQSYKVGYGGNLTGERYCWHGAQQWGEQVLRSNGFTMRAAHAIWENGTGGYPHRAIPVVEAALAGKLQDPRFDRLIYRGRCVSGTPVNVSRRTEARLGRAHRPCRCGEGWLWDWGCGWNGYANFVEWRCDRCTRTYTEYTSPERLSEIRQPANAA